MMSGFASARDRRLRARSGNSPASSGSALLVGFSLLFPAASLQAAPAIDAAAPALVASELQGQTFDLGKLRGKVVLVNYWATWCAPCKKEMPILNSFYRRYHEMGLEVIGISADRPRDFARMRSMSGALAYPTSTLDRISEDGFGPPEGFPLTYVIDRDGIVRDKFIDVREQLLRDVVLPLLRR
jgi:cytochrome c biogenesis protein CcmG/thiol:disulfide interchange protein DsbE